MDKILHRVENMQSKEPKRRTQSSASGRPKRDPSANKSRAANSPARSTRTNGPEAPVASEMLRSNEVPQEGGNVFDWAHTDTKVSIFPGDGKTCILRYWLHKQVPNPDGPTEMKSDDYDLNDLMPMSTLSQFRACFKTMNDSINKMVKQSNPEVKSPDLIATERNEIMRNLAGLITHRRSRDTDVFVAGLTIYKLEQMALTPYLVSLGVEKAGLIETVGDLRASILSSYVSHDSLKFPISSIKAEDGQLNVYMHQDGDEVYLMRMDLQCFTSYFASIITMHELGDECDLKHEDYFDSWVASDMVMKHDLNSAMNNVKLFEYLRLLCVPVSIDTHSNKAWLCMHVKSKNEDIAVKSRIARVDPWLLTHLLGFTLLLGNDGTIATCKLLERSGEDVRIGPCLLPDLYDMDIIDYLLNFDITVSITNASRSSLLVLSVQHDNGEDIKDLGGVVTLTDSLFSRVFAHIHTQLLTAHNPMIIVFSRDKLMQAARTYNENKTHKALFTGYTLTELAKLTLQDYFKHTELDEVTSQSILAELEPETTRTDVTESGGLALNKTLMPQDDVVSLLSKTRDLSVSFRYYSDATIHTGLHRGGQIICYHDIDANDFVKFFPNWIEKESVDINRIRDCLGVGKYYGPWSVEVLKKIDSFEKITEQKMKTDKLAADDVHDKLIGILKRMNAKSSVVDEHNAPAPDLPALDTGNLALFSVQDDSSLMHTDGTAHWMHDCPINRLYQQSPDQAIEAYRRLLGYVFCAYLQRETTEDNYQLGNKFNIIKRNLEIHEHAQQQHRSSHEPSHPYLSYTDFIEAIGHHAYTINGTREKCHIPGEYFKTSWHLPTMNDLMQFTNTGYKFTNDGQYKLTKV